MVHWIYSLLKTIKLEFVLMTMILMSVQNMDTHGFHHLKDLFEMGALLGVGYFAGWEGTQYTIHFRGLATLNYVDPHSEILNSPWSTP